MEASLDLVRVLLGLSDASLRVAWARDAFRTTDAAELALRLEDVAMRAEQGEGRSREALVAIVDALSAPEMASFSQRLREEAAGGPLLALDRLMRQAPKAARLHEASEGRRANKAPDKPPDYGFGRPLTLGERKSLARKHDRGLLARLLADPHPDVIRGLLANPRLTEDDLVALVARRPARPEILAEVARAPRWAHRPRVRLALVLNPATPFELAVLLASLLMRQDLRLVTESTQLSPALRAACNEHLVRRHPRKDDGDHTLQ